MTKRLAAKTGTYEKDGETKGEYVRVGVMLSGNNGGEFMLLDPTINLAGCLTKQNMMNHKNGKPIRDRLLVSVFDDDASQSSGEGRNNPENYNDDIPY